jgi:hypothetical protein
MYITVKYWYGLAVNVIWCRFKIFSSFLHNFQCLVPLEISYECRQDFVREDHEVRSMDKLLSHRGVLWWLLGRASPELGECHSEQFLVMDFNQLTGSESLRDTDVKFGAN